MGSSCSSSSSSSSSSSCSSSSSSSSSPFSFSQFSPPSLYPFSLCQLFHAPPFLCLSFPSPPFFPFLVSLSPLFLFSIFLASSLPIFLSFLNLCYLKECLGCCLYSWKLFFASQIWMHFLELN